MEYFTFMTNGISKQKTIQAYCEDLARETIRIDYPDECIKLL